MKWEDRDINVVQQANTPKFGKLDDIGTHLRLFELFFDEQVREKAGISFEITNEKIRLFLSMLVLSGCYKLPDRNMYWEATPIL